MDIENQSDQYPQIWQVIIVILITVSITFLLGLIGTIIGAKTELFLLEVVIILPALIFTLRHNFSSVILFRLRPVNKKIVFSSVFIGIAFTVVSDEIDRIVQTFFPMPEILRNAIEESLKIQSTSDLIIIVFSAVFLAAIVEELLFRGFVQTSFEYHFDITKAVMASALIFTIIHFNPWWSIQVMIIGVILGVMAWKSNSVIPSMIIHLINNGIALIFANVEPEKYQWYLYKDHVSIPFIIAAILITFYGMKLFYKFCDSSSREENFDSIRQNSDD
jgi:membrane protease YdiL (CAAX protease family)